MIVLYISNKFLCNVNKVYDQTKTKITSGGRQSIFNNNQIFVHYVKVLIRKSRYFVNKFNTYNHMS